MGKNVDLKVAEGFGDEWSRFDQSDLDSTERKEIFNAYFHIFPWQDLPPAASGFDLGCGSGRWALLVSPRVGTLYCIDASEAAFEVARRNLSHLPNCRSLHASVDAIPLADGSQDFGYSLGVLHHVPDTKAALKSCVSKLKSGAPFLLYLYYRFDNKPAWYRALWRLSEAGRFVISRSPMPVRYFLSQILAALVYWPLARIAAVAAKLGLNVSAFPLNFYRNKSFYVMRTDSLDRFGTRLEQRFTRAEITQMMEEAGLKKIRFSASMPFWCAVGTKA